MNRKQKIIVSVTGIFIVQLILVGLTYAYFLTQISGNTNSKSISVTTANLVLEYNDIDDILVSATNIQPGDEIPLKKFSATNKGNSDIEDYAVILENVTNTFTRQQDIVYTLNCKQYKQTKDAQGNVTSEVQEGSCNGVSEQVFPSTGEIRLVVSNDIAQNYKHEYELKVTYINLPFDQGEYDMNKTFSAKVNLKDKKETSIYSSNTLGYKLLNNINGLVSDNVLTNNPTFDGETSDNGLYKATSNYGKTYYYRGPYLNNYVKFGTYKDSYTYGSESHSPGDDMVWRIVRINEDGSIKLMLLGSLKLTTFKNYSYNSGSEMNYNDYVGIDLENWYKLQLSDVDEYISATNYCYDKTGTIDVNAPTYNCRGENIFAKVSGITADELLYAGTYLTNFSGNANNFLFRQDDIITLTLTGGKPSNFPYVISYAASSVDYLSMTGNENYNGVNPNTDTIRPVISVKPSVLLENMSSTGTKTDPFVISDN